MPPDLPNYLALNLARARVHGGQFWSLAGKTRDNLRIWETNEPIVVTRARVKSKTPLSFVDNGGQYERVKGLEPSTFTFATCMRRVLNREIR